MAENKNSLETVETVRGSVPITKLGETLTHEHLASNFDVLKYSQEMNSIDLHSKISLNNIDFISRNPYKFRNNLCLYDDEAARVMCYEAFLFKNNRGGTIVDTSSVDMKCNLSMLRTISNTTGINVVTGTGLFTPDDPNMTQEEIYDIMNNALINGESEFDGAPNVKAAFIGEVGCSFLVHDDFEQNSINATGHLQEQLKCPVMLNPAKRDTWSYIININDSIDETILRMYQESGGDESKAVISHVDRVFMRNKKQFMEFVDNTKCYIQFSMFGNEYMSFSSGKIDILSDAQRIKRIRELKQEGHLHRILISHDIHTKDRLVSFGGQGYSHISANIIPQMLRRDFTIKDTVQTLMIENPRSWLRWSR